MNTCAKCFLVLILLAFSAYESLSQTILQWNKQLNTAVHVDYMTDTEKEMVIELNKVRTDPEQYKILVLDELKKTISDSTDLKSFTSYSIRKKVTVVEGIEHAEIDTIYNNYYLDRLTAIRDLLSDLDSIEPMQILKPHKNLYKAAKEHGNKEAHLGEINHQAQDGSWPWDRVEKAAPDIEFSKENIAMGGCTPAEIVMQLLIDSGVPGYGHRYNILNPNWEFVGCREVTEMEMECGYWIQEFGKQHSKIADHFSNK
ncbi:MAG: hypothetical protein HKN92_01685 [Chitinophagales bacterium]|nr:hypothetical protein [Chitinophagales bacterium]